ncbi:MAG: hypothetical protein U1E06_23125, partial [Tabrizicola sp.]|nr:hypothetical protein [Tabrizicola sp.]
FVEDDWASLSAEFVPGLVKGQAITKSNILRDLATVREVRNELYHSNPIKNSQVFIRAVEALLLSLDINPGRFDDDLRTSTYDRPIFSDLSSGAIPAA